jgi:uncharacterized protein (UPF0276 family)
VSALGFPEVPFGRGFGVGLDMRYGDSHGFEWKAEEGDVVSDRVRLFLEEEGAVFDHVFFSFQPKDRGLLDEEELFAVWDRMFSELPDVGARGLHHTMLNLASIDERVDRTRVLEVTNALIERYDLRWVNEDVGIWSVGGKVMPYPLPPILTREGLDGCTRHVQEVQRGLAAPLVLELPGFSEGTNFVVGDLDAYDFFRELARRTAAPVTLDTGHLLSWRWLLGHRGEALFDELERLPLEACFEIHLSGCHISAGRFVDVHHGVLMPEQLELLRRLLPLCPNLKAVTSEDPKMDSTGRLVRKARAGYEELRHIADGWRGEGRHEPARRIA